MVKILVFDTETTDKGPVGDTKNITYNEKQIIEKALIEKKTDIAHTYWDYWVLLWPYITQLSYIIYDTENPTAAKIFNTYIILPTTVNISSGASAITNMYTTEQDAIDKGVDPNTLGLFILNRMRIKNPEKFMNIETALDEFMNDFNNSEYIVGHNVDFDKKMILAELKRLNRKEDFENLLTKNNFACTLIKTINICKIEGVNKLGKKYIKFPKLTESYQQLFGYAPTKEALHNAIIDVIICLRIFYKLGDPIDMDICGTNVEITKLINSISPQEYQYPIFTITKKIKWF